MADSVLNYTGNSPQVIGVQEASAGSANDFYAQDLVKADSNGELVIATAGVILGIARSPASGTASTVIPVELPNLNDVYVANYKASATAEALIGDVVDFVFTVGAHTLDESSATTDAYVVGLDPRDAVGTSGGRLLFRFNYLLFKGTQ
ncbi:MAG TPA: hypothetical protein VMW50_10315 [Dehalococcoidia bacterium]|nr:hypothetical protein [Dehalococcoidia bacterium]